MKYSVRIKKKKTLILYKIGQDIYLYIVLYNNERDLNTTVLKKLIDGSLIFQQNLLNYCNAAN